MTIYKTSLLVLIFVSFTTLFAQEDNISNMYRLGKTFEQSGDFEKAKEIYQQIHEIQPWNTTYLQSLNEVYIKLKEYDKSISLLENQIEESPANVNLYGILGNTFYTKGDTSKAYDIWNEGLASANNPVTGYRVIINYALQNRAFNKAIEYLKEGKKATDNHNIFALDLARVYSMTMNFEKAAYEYCEIIKEDPTRVQTVIGSMNQYLNRSTAIEQTINAVKEYSEEHDVAGIYQLLIHLYKLNNNYDEAFNFVVKLERTSDIDGKEYFKFAREALNENKYEAASKAFQKIIDEYPNSNLVPSSRIGYAKTFESSVDEKRNDLIDNWKPFSKPTVVLEKEYNEVIQSYESIIKLYSNSDLNNEAFFRIAEVYFHKLNNPETAKEYYSKIIENNSVAQYKVESNLQLAEIEIQSGDLTSAEKRLKTVLADKKMVDQFKSEINLLLGNLYFWKGKYKQSTEFLSQVTNNLFDDNANDALKLLTIIGTLQKDSVNLSKFATAELLAYQNKFDSAATEYNKLKSNQNIIISEFSKLREAQMLIANNQHNEALKILDESSKLGMFAADAEFLKGEIKFFVLKDYPAALTAYRNVLDNYSNSLYFDRSRERIETINELENKSI